ncbi:SpoIIE family protein phosphatase [Synechocystis sp. LKSZ1]|uniref:GAF domain-containing SpoIIE family protein phosphatase n=1 Tax=Synechocystis sp. LKSZ1 TaxID=3144951 RepID=UPI00336C1222
MNEPGPSHEALLAEISQLKQEVADLRQENAFIRTQKQLVENIVFMTRASLEDETRPDHSKTHHLIENLIRAVYQSSEESGVQSSLQNVLHATVELANADKGSLFLLDNQGQVIHSILTRDESRQSTSSEERRQLVQSIFDQGLAGWVYQHQQVGLILDTEQDSRWLTLPDQPYTVRSALAVPILRGQKILAIITLLHSQPRHFNEAVANLLEIMANQIALSLEMFALKRAFQREQSASAMQRQLLENLVERGQCSRETEILKTTLQKTVDLSAELTDAETSSLFLLDGNGKVVDAILSRREVTAQQRASLIGTVLDRGLAGWVIRHQQIGLITDTEQDERWLTLPDQPYAVRSAFAIPILHANQLLGILTLLHSQPRHFSSEVVDQMKMTADQIALVLENARLYSKLDQYSKALDAELKKGRQIQIDFLPYQLCSPPNWDIAACFYPAKQVAGDFYDCFYLDDGEHIGLVIADVCDKGVGAALFMALFRSLIRIFSSQSNLRGDVSRLIEEETPSQGWLGSPKANHVHWNALQAVKLTNDYVALIHPNLCMFATLFFGILDPQSGLLTYINGGHEPLFILDRDGIKATLQPTSPAVGMMPNTQFSLEQVILEPGDILLGYTDGVPEGKNEAGEQFRMQRLLPLLTPAPESAAELLDRIKNELFHYMGQAPQFDDITMLAVRRYLT